MMNLELIPPFDRVVPRNGYAWWYLDAISDDGSEGLTVIAFIGSVFSPYYARARRRGEGDPVNHSAINVVLYRPQGKRWALTERGSGQVSRDARTLQVGPSAMRVGEDSVDVFVDEVTVPVPTRLQGHIRLHPQTVNPQAFDLDAAGRHRWHPLAPRARVEVRMSNPKLSWDGEGYLDFNAGEEPLEEAFQEWCWSRSPTADDGATVFYDALRRDGERTTLALRFGPDGTPEPFATPPRSPLPPGPVWRVSRDTRCIVGDAPKVLRTLEDTPFYTRSMLDTTVLGDRVTAMHESLSLDRFSRPWVQSLLPFRMPRITR